MRAKEWEWHSEKDIPPGEDTYLCCVRGDLRVLKYRRGQWMRDGLVEQPSHWMKMKRPEAQ